jgi:hypothetical protein
MNPGQNMNMSLNHSYLEHVGAFFSGHSPKKSAEKARSFYADQPVTPAGGPHQVNVQTMTHAPVWFPSAPTLLPDSSTAWRCHAVPSSDFSRPRLCAP